MVFSIRFIQNIVQNYSSAMEESSAAFSNITWFIHGTVIAIAQVQDDATKLDLFSSHMHKHALILRCDHFGKVHNHNEWAYCRSKAQKVFLRTKQPWGGSTSSSEFGKWAKLCSALSWLQYQVVPGNSFSRSKKNLQGNRHSIPPYSSLNYIVWITLKWALKEIRLHWSTADYKGKVQLKGELVKML